MGSETGSARKATSPDADLRSEVRRVLDAAREAKVVLRATGGLAVWLRCPSANEPPLARDYKDLDFVGPTGAARPTTALLESLGYRADEEFNQLHGHHRLYFWDTQNQRQLDIFVERIRMSHELDLSNRVTLDDDTITLADLLLTKLQVFEINDKDLKDAVAILADHPLDRGGIDVDRITSLLASDWGWWRTATVNLDKVAAYAAGLEHFAETSTLVSRVEELKRRIDDTPKSMRWRARSKVGERVRWYELPEEIEG
jgi:hypothetical protein